MAFCILRTKKLKSFSAVINSAKHTFREEKTPNADPLRTPKNRSTGAKSSAGLVGALRERLPERRRKDAVLAIEYLVTASPEFFKDTGLNTTHTRASFFNAALEFLRNLHGHANVLNATLHLDETTPHLVAYVVPLNASGKLCAKDFLGGRDKLKRLQTSFYERVGSKFGLERGLQGSSATHQNVKKFYGQISNQPKLNSLSVVDKLADLVGIKTQAIKARAHDESDLIAHSKANVRASMLMVKADHMKIQGQYEAEKIRSAARLKELELERKSKAALTIELQAAKTMIASAKQQSIDLYERNRHLESVARPPSSPSTTKDHDVSKTPKSGLAG